MNFEKLTVTSNNLKKKKQDVRVFDATSITATGSPGQFDFQFKQTMRDLRLMNFELGPATTITWQDKVFNFNSFDLVGWPPVLHVKATSVDVNPTDTTSKTEQAKDEASSLEEPAPMEKIIVTSDNLKKGKPDKREFDATVMSTGVPGQYDFQLKQTKQELSHMRFQLGPATTITWRGQVFNYDSCTKEGWPPALHVRATSVDADMKAEAVNSASHFTLVFNGSFQEKVESIPLKITSPTLKNGAHRVYLVDGSIIGSNHEVIAFKLWATASHLLKHHFTIEEGCYILTDEGSYKAILVALDDYPAYPNIVAEPCPLPDNYPMHIPRVV